MRILFLLHNDLALEQRVNKELDTLAAAGHDVHVCHFPPPGAAVVAGQRNVLAIRLHSRFLPKTPFFWALKYAESTMRFTAAAFRSRPEIVHCVDLLTLLPGFIAASALRIPLVYDSQEIWSGVSYGPHALRRVMLWLERRIARRASQVLVTDEFRAEITTDLLRLERARVTVMMNLPRLSSLTAASRDLRSDSGFESGPVIAYCGVIAPGRHIEESIRALQHLPASCYLAVVGFGQPGYLDQLKKLASTQGLASRVAFVPSIRWSEIPHYLGPAACALSLYEKTTLNNLYSSPSKLFDAALAGVPVVGTDNPLIVHVVKTLGAGECIAEVTPHSIAAAVERVLGMSDPVEVRRRVALTARERYTWECQEAVLRDLYETLEGKKARVAAS